MKETGSIAGAVIACIGVASAIFGIVLLRWLYLNIQVESFRKEITYLRGEWDRARDDLQRKDKELVSIREEFARFKQRVVNNEHKLAENRREIERRAARILWQQEYIERMEALCRKADLKLPRKDRAKWDEEEG